MRSLFISAVVVLAAACGPSGNEADTGARAAAPAAVVGETAVAPSGNSAAEGAPAAASSVPEPRLAVIEQELAYGESSERNLLGYLAMPADAIEPQPGLLLVHERWGLNEDVRALARRLAGEGFVVLAVDLFGRQTAETPAQSQALVAALTAAPEATLANLRQGYNYLSRYALAPKVASIGWSVGGTWALQLGLALGGEELDAVVVYYGQIVRDRDELAALEMPLLGFFGADDASIPVADVQAFRVALNELGKDADIRIYSRVGHAFANPSSANYDAESAEDSWQRTIAFLDRVLR